MSRLDLEIERVKEAYRHSDAAFLALGSCVFSHNGAKKAITNIIIIL